MLELVKLVGMKLDQDKLGMKRILELAQLPFPLSFILVLPMMAIIQLHLECICIRCWSG
jgi:hypothetical protein